MQNWELAIEKFISQYKDEDYFLGAILTGSYATGNYDENSDIDIYIVTKDNLTWRERGNTYQYCFEAGKVNRKRKQITKCGFKTKNDIITRKKYKN